MISIGEMENELLEIVWHNENIPSGQLVKICDEKFGWKKSTTYTMLKRLQEKGVLINEDGSVHSLVSKDDIAAMKSEQLLSEEFEGSLPRFIAAFAGRKKLSSKEIDEIQKMIDDFRKE